MKIYKSFTLSVLFILMVSGCVSVDPFLKKFESKDTKLVQQYIAKGESLEKESRFSDALEQYKLALTADPESKEAAQHKKDVLAKLWRTAQLHYKKGLQLDRQGQYEAARKEYLSALQNWPDYKVAKDRLISGGVGTEVRDYIVHTLKYGESVSLLAEIYYGDLKKHTIIGKFNILKDGTKVCVGQRIKIPVIAGVSLSDLKQKQEKYLHLKEVKPLVSEEPKSEKEPEPEPEKEPVEEKKPMEIPSVTIESPPSEKKVSDDFEKGIELFNKKEYAKATSLFMAVEKMYPDNEILRDYLFKSHFQQGLSLFNTKKYLLAKDHFESALAYDKDCDKCPGYIKKCEETYKDKHYNLGIHYFGKERLNKAIEEWKLVKEIDPDYKEVTPNLKKAEMLFKRLERIKQGISE